MSRGPSSVLDASALLALIRGEPGGDMVAEHLVAGCWVSTVNWAEVLARVARTLGSVDAAEHRLWSQPSLHATLFLHPFDETCAREAARLLPTTKALGSSLADRACLAVGRITGLPVLTCDRAWSEIDLNVEIRLIR